MKPCISCLIPKDESEFHMGRNACKECRNTTERARDEIKRGRPARVYLRKNPVTSGFAVNDADSFLYTKP